MVNFETNRYSVPAKYIGEKVSVKVTAQYVQIIINNEVIAIHDRVVGRYSESLILDHYLDILLKKSRALSNTKVYQPQKLPKVYEVYRKQLIARKSKGNREFVKILMLHRDYTFKQVTEALEIADSYN